MQYRSLGRTGWKVSEISFGAWAIGGSWGRRGRRANPWRPCDQAVDCGVNFIDTADVYGMGRSERLIAQLKRDRKETSSSPPRPAAASPRTPPMATTRRTSPRSSKTACATSPPIASTWCSSIARPPTSITGPKSFGVLDRLMEAGKIRYYGVSVERVEEALKAIEYPNVQTRADHLQLLPPSPGRAVLRAGQEEAGRHSGARSAGQRHAHRQANPAIAIRRRRSSQLQSPRRSLRCRRDVFGSGLRDGAGSGGGDPRHRCPPA